MPERYGLLSFAKLSSRDLISETFRLNSRLDRLLSIQMALSRPRPANKSTRDWRMALRRKLNGDTR